MDEANPYRAVSPAPDERRGGRPRVEEERLASGSHLRIGPRRAFTAAWLARVAWIRNGIPAVPTAGVAVLSFALLVGLDRPFLAAAAILAWMPLVLVVLPIYQGHPRIGGRKPGPLAAGRDGHVVDLTFEPRLPGDRSELSDTADDVGVLWVEGDALCFEGDRCSLRLRRADARDVRRKRVAVSVQLGHGEDALVRLRAPLAGQIAFHVGPRPRFDWIVDRRSGDPLRRFVDDWYAGASR